MPPRIQDLHPGEFGRPLPKPRIIAGTILLILFLIFTTTSYYTVDPEEVGVIQRFGRYHATTEPGLHFKLPFGIDTLNKVKVRQQRKAEFGFRTEQAGVLSRFRGPKEDTALLDEALMLTGDLNMSVVEWSIQYRVSDPKEYLFNLRDPEKTLRDATESVMREVVGDHSVDEVLTYGRQEIEAAVFKSLQELLKNYKIGIKIDQVVLQGVTPPSAVEASFNEVNQAQQERESAINIARSDYNKAVPKASGEAQQKIEEANGYAIKRVNEAMGDATRFEAVLTAYRKAPEVTRQRIYLETMTELIPKLGRKLIIDRDVQQLLPMLSLNPTPEASK